MTLKMVQHHLVLLPGLDGTGSLFGPLLNNLPIQFTASVVAYPCDKALNYQQLFPHIREAIPWGNPYTLVAESFSGPLALLFAAEQTEDIQAIVLCASFATNPLHPIVEWARHLLKDSLFRKPPPEALLLKYLAGEDCPPAFLEGVKHAIASVRPEVLAHRIHMMLDTDARPALQACEKPLLYLLAEQDKIVGKRGLEAIQAAKPRNVTAVSIDAPHLLLQRQPREAIAAIERFLLTLNVAHCSA
jgi:pimeloyl-ACP methyl ester carboxylesterase